MVIMKFSVLSYNSRILGLIRTISSGGGAGAAGVDGV